MSRARSTPCFCDSPRAVVVCPLNIGEPLRTVGGFADGASAKSVSGGPSAYAAMDEAVALGIDLFDTAEIESWFVSAGASE